MAIVTEEEASILSKMAYMNLDPKMDLKNKSLQEIAIILREKKEEKEAEGAKPWDFGSWGNLTNKEQYDMLKDIEDGKYENLSNLKLKEYNNQENTTGFVGYAFEDGNDSKNVVCAFRGTQGNAVGDDGFLATLDGKTGIGWIDNGYVGTKGWSRQFDPTKAFVEANMVAGGETFVTGHSKGAGNAAYACATIEGVTGFAFDGPGIGQALLPAQRERIAKSGFINCVEENCPVGAMLFHPEQRIFAKQNAFSERNKDGQEVGPASGMGLWHSMQAMAFENGNVITGERSMQSQVVEYATKSAYVADQLLMDPLGKLVDITQSGKRTYATLETALSNMGNGMSAAISNNMDKTGSDIVGIINAQVPQIRQDIINCENDMDAINNRIGLGMQNMNAQINQVMQQSQTELTGDINRISQGFGQVVTSFDFKSELQNIENSIANGNGVIESIYNEETKQLATGASGIMDIVAGIGKVEVDSINGLGKACDTVLTETGNAVADISYQLSDLVTDGTVAAQTLNNGLNDMEASIKNGLTATGLDCISELDTNLNYVANKTMELGKDLIEIELGAGKRQAETVKDYAGMAYDAGADLVNSAENALATGANNLAEGASNLKDYIWGAVDAVTDNNQTAEAASQGAEESSPQQEASAENTQENAAESPAVAATPQDSGEQNVEQSANVQSPEQPALDCSAYLDKWIEMGKGVEESFGLGLDAIQRATGIGR